MKRLALHQPHRDIRWAQRACCHTVVAHPFHRRAIAPDRLNRP